MPAQRPHALHVRVAGLVVGVAGLALLLGGQPAVHAEADGIRQVGAGSITTEQVGAPPQGCSPLTTDARAFLTPTAPRGAVPTNSWWSSLVFKRGGNCVTSSPLFAHPVAYQPETDGLGLSYPTEPVLQGAPGGIGTFHLPYVEDLRVAVDGMEAPVVEVADWSDWTVTPSWSDGSRTMTATIGHGLPFSWYRMTGGDAVLTATDDLRVWLDDGPRVGFTAGSSDYVAVAPSGASWSSDGATLRSDLAGGDHLSVALLPTSPTDTDADRRAVAASYAAHAHAEVTGTRADYTYDAATSTVRTVHHLTTEPLEGTGVGTVVALYPHQTAHLDDVAGTGPADGVGAGTAYTSPRGEMTTLVGATAFTTATPFTGVLPEVPAVATGEGAARDRLDQLLDDAAADPMNLQRNDVYWTGKALGRAARIVEVADQVGHVDARDAALDQIERTLSDWFTASPGTTERLFAYNEDWGTLVGSPAAHGSDTELNDHHFHHGYFVVAAATLARFSPEWAAQDAYGGMVDELIADANGFDRDDTRYPYLRTFDVYAGHDWASGHGAFAAGNNQESSSEAQNLANGMIQWGAVTGDLATRDAGIYLHATQAAAIQQYWFGGSGAIPDAFGHPTVGIIWGSGGAYDTWFSRDPEMVQGINALPVTGGHLYLGTRPDDVIAQYEHLRTVRGGDPTVWKDIVWSHLALGDGPRALAALDTDPHYTEEAGGSRAHTYHWIANLASLGVVDTTVHADHPLAVAFDGPEGRTHVAANTGPDALTVRFSDGATLEVPAGRTVTAGAHEWSGGGPGDPSDPTGPVPSIEVALDPAAPDGEDGWYVSPVTLDLASDDEDAVLEWRHDGDWSVWTEPVTLHADGSYRIEARASGDHGPSDVEVVDVHLDRTPPVTTATVIGDVREDGRFVGEVTVRLTASDETSGVRVTRVRLPGGDGVERYDGPVTFADPGTHELEFRSVDVAGNQEPWRRVTVELAAGDDVAPIAPPVAPGTPPGGAVCERRQGGTTFPDAPGSGHRPFIDCLAELGIVQGMPDGRFRPGDDVTRGQLASFVVRAIETATGRPMPTGRTTFPDVPAGSTHGPAILKLREAGIVRGFGDGTFRPADPVRRDQTARYVVNAVEQVIEEALPRSGASFRDVAAGSQFGSDIDALVTAGVVSGYADGTFGPRASVTRGQMARFVGNALDELDRRGAYHGA